MDQNMIGRIISIFGIHTSDALHIGCAIKNQCGYFVTSDKSLVKNTKKHGLPKGIKVLDPNTFLGVARAKSEVGRSLMK